MKLSNIMIGYCIFSLFISLFFGAYAAGTEAYGITTTNTVGEDLNDLNLIDGMTSTASGVLQITNPTGFFDIIGGLLSVAIGVIKTLTGVLTTPFEILDIIMGTYINIPSVIYMFIGAIMAIYASFILIKAYTGQEH